MTTGAEHYAKAEQMLQSLMDAFAKLADEPSMSRAVMEGAPVTLAAAQVHATLALVAVIHDRETGTRESLRDAKWREALG